MLESLTLGSYSPLPAELAHLARRMDFIRGAVRKGRNAFTAIVTNLKSEQSRRVEDFLRAKDDKSRIEALLHKDSIMSLATLLLQDFQADTNLQDQILDRNEVFSESLREIDESLSSAEKVLDSPGYKSVDDVTWEAICAALVETCAYANIFAEIVASNYKKKVWGIELGEDEVSIAWTAEQVDEFRNMKRKKFYGILKKLKEEAKKSRHYSNRNSSALICRLKAESLLHFEKEYPVLRAEHGKAVTEDDGSPIPDENGATDPTRGEESTDDMSRGQLAIKVDVTRGEQNEGLVTPLEDGSAVQEQVDRGVESLQQRGEPTEDPAALEAARARFEEEDRMLIARRLQEEAEARLEQQELENFPAFVVAEAVRPKSPRNVRMDADGQQDIVKPVLDEMLQHVVRAASQTTVDNANYYSQEQELDRARFWEEVFTLDPITGGVVSSFDGPLSAKREPSPKPAPAGLEVPVEDSVSQDKGRDEGDESEHELAKDSEADQRNLAEQGQVVIAVTQSVEEQVLMEDHVEDGSKEEKEEQKVEAVAVAEIAIDEEEEEVEVEVEQEDPEEVVMEVEEEVEERAQEVEAEEEQEEEEEQDDEEEEEEVGLEEEEEEEEEEDLLMDSPISGSIAHFSPDANSKPDIPQSRDESPVCVEVCGYEPPVSSNVSELPLAPLLVTNGGLSQAAPTAPNTPNSAKVRSMDSDTPTPQSICVSLCCL